MPASKEKQAEVAIRREKVVAMRAKGIPPSVIAYELGITEQTVYEDVHHSLQARRDAINRDRDLLVALEAEELDTIRRSAWEVVGRTHFHVGASGRVSVHPDTEQPLHDDAPTLHALSVLLRTQERRSRLLGLDSAQKLEMRTEVITLDAIDAALADLRRQLDAMPAPTRGELPHEA